MGIVLGVIGLVGMLFSIFLLLKRLISKKGLHPIKLFGLIYLFMIITIAGAVMLIQGK